MKKKKHNQKWEKRPEMLMKKKQQLQCLGIKQTEQCSKMIIEKIAHVNVKGEDNCSCILTQD